MELCTQTPVTDVVSHLRSAGTSTDIREQDMVLTDGVDGEFLLMDLDTPPHKIDPIEQEG